VQRFPEPKSARIHFTSNEADLDVTTDIKRTHPKDRSQHSCKWSGRWLRIQRDATGAFVMYYGTRYPVTLTY